MNLPVINSPMKNQATKILKERNPNEIQPINIKEIKENINWILGKILGKTLL